MRAWLTADTCTTRIAWIGCPANLFTAHILLESKRAVAARLLRDYVSRGALIPVAVTPATLVRVWPSVISPFPVNTRAIIVGVAPVVVALSVCRAADNVRQPRDPLQICAMAGARDRSIASNPCRPAPH